MLLPGITRNKTEVFQINGSFSGDPGLAARPRLAAAPPRGPPLAHGARSRRRGNTATPPATATHTATGGARGRLWA